VYNIAPRQYQSILEKLVLHRVFYLPQGSLGLLDWTEKVYNFVERLGDDNA